MNVLGLVFSLILMLSFGFLSLWEKQLGSSRLRSTYLGHERANRNILNHYQSEFYKTLNSKRKASSASEEEEEESQEIAKQTKAPQIPKLNGECAKINLWPLIEEGRGGHPLLYELMAKLLREFYGSSLFENKARFEYQFLDTLLEAARQGQLKKNPLLLEKLELSQERWQKMYYWMLKGTKECHLREKVGYPSLLDYVKLEPGEEKICFSHAHPDLISIFFGFKVADKIYAELHTRKKVPVTKESIQEWCSQAHIFSVDPDLFELIELEKRRHELGAKRTLLGQDGETQVSLRQKVYMEKQSG